MNVIIITLPDFFDGETALVNRLFMLGMQRLHLRKPKSSEQELATWIEEINEEFRPRIVLHDYHQLAMRYNLGGIHLNSRNPSIPVPYPSGMTVSRSCHSLEEVVKYKDECDYLFLSPIFESISKEGYGSAFSSKEIEQAHSQGIIDEKVYALGGITFDKLRLIESMGFGGAAILGDLWYSIMNFSSKK